MATVPDIEIDEELKQSLDYCDRMIAEGDETGAFIMMKRELLADDGRIDGKWDEYKKLESEGKL